MKYYKHLTSLINSLPETSNRFPKLSNVAWTEDGADVRWLKVEMTSGFEDRSIANTLNSDFLSKAFLIV